jgi:hypothetical protein
LDVIGSSTARKRADEPESHITRYC